MSEPKFGEKFYKHNGRITILQISAAVPGWWVQTDEGSSPVASWALCALSYPECDVYQDILPVISTDKGMKPVDIKNMGFQCVMITQEMIAEMGRNSTGQFH
ncbi:hypothetical protein E9H87_003558 [Escherichia coli]|nr:hypothetical protein [Escherichia coli]EEY8276174.1 hypothetical protein [Escherichia coli]EEY8334997.1 hypothetical protein [Escherichia coli]EEY8783484.1 hypothetical protein [Escherichia coli]EEY9142796.1 hypothetical protein [Escherichia coli]